MYKRQVQSSHVRNLQNYWLIIQEAVSYTHLIQRLYSAHKRGERTVTDLDAVADGIVHHDFALLHAELGDLILGQRSWLVGGAHKPGDAADILHHIPALIGHHHLDEHIAGEYLPVVGLGLSLIHISRWPDGKKWRGKDDDVSDAHR